MFNISQPFFSSPPILKIFALFLSSCVFREAFSGMVSRRMRGERKTRCRSSISNWRLGWNCKHWESGQGLHSSVSPISTDLQTACLSVPGRQPEFTCFTSFPTPPSTFESLWLIRGGLGKAEKCSGGHVTKESTERWRRKKRDNYCGWKRKG